MMDYKELIRRLDNCGEFDGDLLDAAAEAIETLLAERDAAVDDLRHGPHHSTCKYGKHCDYISAVTGFPDCCACDGWEWRGPQKEDKHEVD